MFFGFVAKDLGVHGETQGRSHRIKSSADVSNAADTLRAHVSNLAKFSESARLRAQEKKAEQVKYESKN